MGVSLGSFLDTSAKLVGRSLWNHNNNNWGGGPFIHEYVGDGSRPVTHTQRGISAHLVHPFTSMTVNHSVWYWTASLQKSLVRNWCCPHWWWVSSIWGAAHSMCSFNKPNISYSTYVHPPSCSIISMRRRGRGRVCKLLVEKGERRREVRRREENLPS